MWCHCAREVADLESPSLSFAGVKKGLREIAYASTDHTVVDSAEFFKSSLHHVVQTGFISDVDFHSYCLERDVLGKLLASLSSSEGAFFVDICEGYAYCSGFRKGEGCFFANAASCLKEPT